MLANKAVGEIVISATIDNEAVDILLRPSFYAFSSIGTTEEIDATIKSCFDALENGLTSKYGILSCLSIIMACMKEHDRHLFPVLFGEYELTDSGIKYIDGAINRYNIIVIANHLVKWGVVGNPKQRSRKSKDRHLFDPSEYVGAAAAHLNIGTSAWDLTMTEFQRAIESKYPLDPKKEPIPQDRLEDLLKKSKAAHAKLDPNRMSNQARLARNRHRR